MNARIQVTMDQTEIQPPTITDGSRYSFLYAMYLHMVAALLRHIVSYISGPHDGFDRDLVIHTPGLGSGNVRISVCLPPHRNDKTAVNNPKPLVLVLEGGGFVMGQPKDGKKNDRLIANEVWILVYLVTSHSSASRLTAL